ncbi:MAG TPA: nucleoside transporter C-terminal domain-containing protein [Kiritimatiellia bacterium]|nr:nucleoside transporter C-terminal domain-containing protein [Kiritimatiellia bacterium]
MWILRGLLGITVLLALAWALSENRRRVEWKVVAWGVGLQFGIALLLVHVPLFQRILMFLNRGVSVIERASREGGSFVFGYLAGGEAPFPLQEGFAAPPALFFFGPLMMLIVVGALSAVLFHFGILQRVVGLFARLLRRTMGLGGAEGVAVAANVFMGQSDAPLLIKPYVSHLGRAGLMCVMVAGMTTISGSLMVVYASMLEPILPGIVLGHLVTASLISAPAAVMVARLMVPAAPGEVDHETPELPVDTHGVVDALLVGANDGARVMVNVAIMLVAIIAVVSLVNSALGLLPLETPLTLERMAGWIMAPAMWLAGVPWAEAQAAGELMALKTVFNEFVAYLALARQDPAALSVHSRLIVIYSLCGFANFSSVGILAGTLSALCPEHKRTIASLGLKAMVAGTLATLLTGAVIGIIVKP